MVYTEAELKTKILEVDTAIETILLNGQSYTLNTGHGSQTVTRANLTELRKMRDYWAELYRYEFSVEPTLVSITTNRGSASEYRSGS